MALAGLLLPSTAAKMSAQPQLSEQGASTRGTDPFFGGDADAARGGMEQSPPALGAGIVLSRNPVIARLPVEIDVAVPIRRFRVRNLLALAGGQLIESQWDQGEDLPLAARGAQLAWAEFEVMDARLAVRITRLV